MANIRNLIFYIPFSYTFSTRLKTIVGCIRLFSKYVLPVVFISFCRNEFTIDWLLIIIGLLFVYDLYEIGYIQNDTETIKHESNPTLRLSESALTFYEHRKFSIYAVRFITALLLSLLIFFRKGWWPPILLGFLLVPSYLFYNAIRNKYSYWIYLWLMMIRYISLAWIYCASLSLIDMLYITFMHPIPTMIIRFSVNRFEYYNQFVHKYLIKNIKYLNRFRFKYYLLFTILCLVYYIIDKTAWLYIVVNIWYLLIALTTSKRDKKTYGSKIK